MSVRAGWSGRVRTAWCRLWFEQRATLPLEIVRIGTGLALLAAFAPLSGELSALFGDRGWISQAALETLGTARGRPSLLAPASQAWHLALFHALFLAACAALTLGWRTRWIKWLVWVGFLSYVDRNPFIFYGVDRLLACQLFLLCVAPIGRRLALDGPREGTPTHSLPAWEEATAVWSSTVLRLLQIQMAVVFFFAGAQKLRGELWWSGEAVWVALNNIEFSRFPTDWLAGHFWVVNLLTYGVVLLELAYPLLVWQRSTRPWLLGAAVTFHLGTAVLLGLHLFALVAIVGHLAFLRPEWIAAWVHRSATSSRRVPDAPSGSRVVGRPAHREAG